jgi:photosystem II stability/assembly factor-like uncharacterized protein
MVTATAGWALLWTGNPNSRSAVTVVLARTVDGGHTWTEVTPAAARPMLTPNTNYAIVDARSATSAWLAVTLVRSPASKGATQHRTEVFVTADGGRHWRSSAPIRSPGVAGWLATAGRSDGWLLQNLGAAMQQNSVRLYRSTDAGRRWSLIAQTPPPATSGSGSSGLPTECDKTGVSFATSSIGFIAGACNDLGDAFLVTRDAGRHWAPQPLPTPPSACESSGCFVTPPQFFNSKGFMTVGAYPGPGYVLTSQDTGRTWRVLALPAGAGPYPKIQMRNATHGLLIPAGPQGSYGRVFYATSDGGVTWRPVPQGRPVWQPGTTIQFATTQSGFAWNMNSQSPAIYATANGGRTWSRFIPLS